MQVGFLRQLLLCTWLFYSFTPPRAQGDRWDPPGQQCTTWRSPVDHSRRQTQPFCATWLDFPVFGRSIFASMFEPILGSPFGEIGSDCCSIWGSRIDGTSVFSSALLEDRVATSFPKSFFSGAQEVDTFAGRRLRGGSAGLQPGRRGGVGEGQQPLE